MAHSIVGDRTQTSFDAGLNRFTWLMMRFMAVMVPLVFLINGLPSTTGRVRSSLRWLSPLA